MNKPAPIFAKDTTAARLLEMPRTRFLDLVERGALPPGKEIAPGEVRWYVPDLIATLRGQPGEALRW